MAVNELPVRSGELVVCTSPSFKVTCGKCPTVIDSPCKNVQDANEVLWSKGWEWQENIGWVCSRCVRKEWRESHVE